MGKHPGVRNDGRNDVECNRVNLGQLKSDGWCCERLAEYQFRVMLVLECLNLKGSGLVEFPIGETQ
jgi:hypothetical protein